MARCFHGVGSSIRRLYISLLFTSILECDFKNWIEHLITSKVLYFNTIFFVIQDALLATLSLIGISCTYICLTLFALSFSYSIFISLKWILNNDVHLSCRQKWKILFWNTIFPLIMKLRGQLCCFLYINWFYFSWRQFSDCQSEIIRKILS